MCRRFFRPLLKTYRDFKLMSHSCFSAFAFAVIADKLLALYVTLHRLNFPANERVDFNQSACVSFKINRRLQVAVYFVTANFAVINSLRQAQIFLHVPASSAGF